MTYIEPMELTIKEEIEEQLGVMDGQPYADCWESIKDYSHIAACDESEAFAAFIEALCLVKEEKGWQ